MIRTAAILGAIGLAVATALIVREGFSAVLAALGAAGLGVLWASLAHFIPMALNARAWQVLVPGAQRPGIAFFTWLVWVREAVNGLLPVARIGGEVVCARLMVRHGMRTAPAIASLAVDVTLTIATQLIFTAAGLILLAAETTEQGLLMRLLFGLLGAVPLVVLLLAVQRFGMFQLLARAFRLIFGERWAGLLGHTRRLDRAIRLCYRRRDRILACCLWQLAGWVAGASEIWLALYFLGHPVRPVDALVVEALIQAASSAAFVVPAALGVQEGGFLLLGTLIGLGPEIALALALARRARDVIVFVPALLAWQVQEGRRFLARAAPVRAWPAGRR